MKAKDFFSKPLSVAQKQYEALRMHYYEGVSAKEVAERFGYAHRGFTTIAGNFLKKLKAGKAESLFFEEVKKGRKTSAEVLSSKELIISMRKQQYSVEDIKIALDSKGVGLCEKTIYNVIQEEGFSRLPRRLKTEKQELQAPPMKAEKSKALALNNETFKSAMGGVLVLVSYIADYGIDEIIRKSKYPETKQIDRLSSILSFIALKSSNIRRYSADDMWCMDRGLGMFAGLNVLPKTSWYSSYSSRVTSDMNLFFLRALHEKWLSEGLLGDTANLDFTTIPYWGESDHLENNWSGKRSKALSSMLAVLAQDPDSGIIDYGNTNVMHKEQDAVVLEFLDFYNSDGGDEGHLKYLIFDSKFTNYENLNKLNQKHIKFVTIRRRGKNMLDEIRSIPPAHWQTIRVNAAGNKKRTLKIYQNTTKLKGYDGDIRQIFITGHGKSKPAIVITNDFDVPTGEIIRKYSRRWIVEKAISEQIEFFHLNNVSSSMVIKVDFDLTMSILTHNLFRLFAKDLDRYSNLSDTSVFEKLLCNGADIAIEENTIKVVLKKKRNLPIILETMAKFAKNKIKWLGNKNIHFSGASYS